MAGAETTLGPKGMDKMMVDTMGDVVITNDGVTILKEMDIEHPAAKMMVEIAKTQDTEVGDGTTTAVILAGELLKQSEELLEQDIHPTVIAAGYRAAADKCMEVLKGLAIKVTANDQELLKSIAVTAMTGKGSQVAREGLADIAVEAIRAIVDEDGSVDTDNITVEKKVGGSISDSKIVRGVVIDKERLHPNMPKKVINARIALLNAAVEIEKTEADAKIQITSPTSCRHSRPGGEHAQGMVERIAATGANVLFVQKGIDDLAQHYLAKAGIFTIRRIKKSDMEKLARATGGRVITSLHEISKEDLGKAGLVEERKVSDEKMTFVEECNIPSPSPSSFMAELNMLSTNWIGPWKMPSGLWE